MLIFASVSKINVLILCAFALEVEPILKNWPWKKLSKDLFELEVNEYKLTMKITGQGKVKAALASLDSMSKSKADRSIWIGCAGALHLKAPAVSIVSDVLEVDFETMNQKPPKYKCSVVDEFWCLSHLPKVKVASQDKNVFSESDRKATFDKYGADYATWESAGYFQACKMMGTEAVEVRFTSDYEAPKDFNEFRTNLIAAAQWQLEWFPKVFKC